ncbi:helix-turn-helix domain-containing protein [Roseomonas tokyonensis]|nr:helix-turn-helix domain-containing protein [Falsiroseomonas tokyonensis]
MSSLPPPPLTPEALANRWDCKPDHIRALCRQGRLRHFSVGRQVRIPQDAALEYESRCGKSSTEAGGMRSGAKTAGHTAVLSAPRIMMPPSGR